MVPALGRQRQSQQMVPKKPSSSLPEILRGWLLRDMQEQIPNAPCPIPTGAAGAQPSGTALLGAIRMQHPWVLSTSAWFAGPQHVPSLSFLPVAVLGCSLEPQSAGPGCVLLVPMPSSLVSQRSQTESAMETFPQQQPGDPSTVHTCQSPS